MINNKQINLWRGKEEPPTIYHLWIKDDLEIKIFNGEEWITFIDNAEIAEKLNEIWEAVKAIHAKNLKTQYDGTYIKKEDTLKEAFEKLDTLLETQIIE